MTLLNNLDLNLLPEGALPYFTANRNVLVVEDDRFMAQLFADLLCDAGFIVTLANNGVNAVEELYQRSIDFVILDVLMPIMNGLEFYRQIQRDPATKAIPVMVVTAWTDSTHLDHASQLGIHHFLAKPFTEHDLLEEVLALLKDQVKVI